MRQSNAETGADRATANADGRTMPGEVKPNTAPESLLGFPIVFTEKDFPQKELNLVLGETE